MRHGGVSEIEVEAAEKGVPLGVDAINPLAGRLSRSGWLISCSWVTGPEQSWRSPRTMSDHAFATRYALPIIQVVAPADGTPIDAEQAAWPAKKDDAVTVNSGAFSGLDFKTAFDRIAEDIEKRGLERA